MGQSDSLPVKIISQDGKDELQVKGYRLHKRRCALAALVILLTLGLVLILVVWRRDIKMFMFYTPCPLQHATKVLVKDSFDQFYDEDVLEERSGPALLPKTRYFVNKKIKYIWDINGLQFLPSKLYDDGLVCAQFHENFGGLSPKEIEEGDRHYGPNIIKITVTPIYKLLFKEVANPFYLFQFYTIVVWMAQEYWDYSSIVILTTIISVGFAVHETRKQMIKLRKMSQTTGTVIVIRGGVEKRLTSTQLVPGDVICLTPQESQIFYCDAVLIEGTCSVDESMLTGESYPITKMPVPREDETAFDYKRHQRHIIYCGTLMVQGRSEFNHPYIKAVVIRTGFSTSKGELMRNILFPKPIQFRFYADLIQVTTLFLFFGLGGMIYSMYSWIHNGASAKDVILNSLDIVTFVVPPMLPAALTATTVFAQRRLKARKIYCLSAKHISLAGGVDVVCFDKTGTLTETDVDLSGAIPIQEGEFRHPVVELPTLPESHPMLHSIATAHSLIRLPTTGQLSGYSVDKKLFEATGWSFKDGPQGVNSAYGLETPFIIASPVWSDKRESTYSPTTELAVLKRFPFESTVKRMTVITQRLASDHYIVYLKGAPETIANICNPITVPSNYYQVLKHYTLQGYRVLAVASKTFSPHLTWSHIQRMSREEVESNPELIGLLIMRNQLKKETNTAIKVLHKAALKTIMVTGDNLQTAVAVAKECQMIDKNHRVIQVEAKIVPASVHGAQHLQVLYNDPMSEPEFIGQTMKKLQDVHNGVYCFAMEGSTFEVLRQHDPKLLDKCAHRAKVFARMAPEHKQQLMEVLQNIGRQVAMVGDGCNDCGALRTADAGISLSMTDASVAAPFTSQETNISCVEALIREGRSTLDAAFGTFQFAIGICFTFFIGVLMLYSISTEPSDFQYFVWDLGIALVPFFTIGNVAPAQYLHERRPLRHLWGFLPMFSFFTFLLWQTIALLIGWYYCQAQPWFEPYVFEPGKVPPNPSYEETTIFYLLTLSTIAAAFVFTPSAPYSLHVYSNRIFAVWSVVATILALCLMFITDQAFVDFLNFKSPPHAEYTFVILVIGVASGVISYCWEKFLVRGFLYQWFWPKLNRMRPARHQYQKIEKELKSKPEWPKLGGIDVSKQNDVVVDMSPSRASSPIDILNSSATSSKMKIITPTPSRSSIKDLVGRAGKTNFRTFQGSRRGGYTINGPKTDAIEHHEVTPMSSKVEEADEETFDYDGADFPPPPPLEEFEANEEDNGPASPVQVLAIRSYDPSETIEDNRNIAAPPSSSNKSPLRGMMNKGGMAFNKESELPERVEDEVVDHDVELVSYRISRRPSDLSPSQQRRHLNGQHPRGS